MVADKKFLVQRHDPPPCIYKYALVWSYIRNIITLKNRNGSWRIVLLRKVSGGEKLFLAAG